MQPFQVDAHRVCSRRITPKCAPAVLKVDAQRVSMGMQAPVMVGRQLQGDACQKRVMLVKIVNQTACYAAGAAGADLELQPNAAAPLLRTSKARREWIEQEMELCSTSWHLQKVSCTGMCCSWALVLCGC